METVFYVVCMVALICCLNANLLIAWLVWKHFRDKQESPMQIPMVEETPEEIEARRLEAKAQAEYAQGLINMMNFTGQPPKRDGD